MVRDMRRLMGHSKPISIPIAVALAMQYETYVRPAIHQCRKPVISAIWHCNFVYFLAILS